jgi:hypothetical protein
MWFSQFWKLTSPRSGKASAAPLFIEGLLLHIWCLFPVSSHGGKPSYLSMVSFLRAFSPPLFIPSFLGLGFQVMNFLGGDKNNQFISLTNNIFEKKVNDV